MKLRFKIFSVIVILCILIGAGVVLASDANFELEGDSHSFKDLSHDIKNANGTLNMTGDYKCLSNDSKLKFKGDNLTINGNGHMIDGSNMAKARCTMK